MHRQLCSDLYIFFTIAVYRHFLRICICIVSSLKCCWDSKQPQEKRKILRIKDLKYIIFNLLCTFRRSNGHGSLGEHERVQRGN